MVGEMGNGLWTKSSLDIASDEISRLGGSIWSKWQLFQYDGEPDQGLLMIEGSLCFIMKVFY